jgi:tellurite methyltransferase
MIWTNRLDPRPAAEASRNPYCRAVNIPLDELRARVAELPPKGAEIIVLGPPEAADVLLGMGRVPVIAEPEEGIGGIYRLWRANALIEDCAAVEGLGRTALDLACGTGRDAVLLASRGYRVTAIDHLTDAIERAQALEARYAPPSVQWEVADVRSLVLHEQYDLISLSFFFDADVVRSASEALRPEGQILIEAFTPTHRTARGKPKAVVTSHELAELVRPLQIVRCEEGWHGDRHTVRLIAKNAA